MKPKQTAYYVSGYRLILPGIFLGLFTMLFLGLFVIGSQENIGMSLFFLIPLLVILPFSLPRYLRLLSLTRQSKPALEIKPQALLDHINRGSYAWNEIQEIRYSPGIGKSSGNRVVIDLYNGRRIELPHKLIGCTHTELVQSLQDFHAEYRSDTPPQP